MVPSDSNIGGRMFFFYRLLDHITKSHLIVIESPWFLQHIVAENALATFFQSSVRLMKQIPILINTADYSACIVVPVVFFSCIYQNTGHLELNLHKYYYYSDAWLSCVLTVP